MAEFVPGSQPFQRLLAALGIDGKAVDSIEIRAARNEVATVQIRYVAEKTELEGVDHVLVEEFVMMPKVQTPKPGYPENAPTITPCVVKMGAQTALRAADLAVDIYSNSERGRNPSTTALFAPFQRGRALTDQERDYCRHPKSRWKVWDLRGMQRVSVNVCRMPNDAYIIREQFPGPDVEWVMNREAFHEFFCDPHAKPDEPGTWEPENSVPLIPTGKPSCCDSARRGVINNLTLSGHDSGCVVQLRSHPCEAILNGRWRQVQELHGDKAPMQFLTDIGRNSDNDYLWTHSSDPPPRPFTLPFLDSAHPSPDPEAVNPLNKSWRDKEPML